VVVYLLSPVDVVVIGDLEGVDSSFGIFKSIVGLNVQVVPSVVVVVLVVSFA
jgi:hypothetical protein